MFKFTLAVGIADSHEPGNHAHWPACYRKRGIVLIMAILCIRGLCPLVSYQVPQKLCFWLACSQLYAPRLLLYADCFWVWVALPLCHAILLGASRSLPMLDFFKIVASAKV